MKVEDFNPKIQEQIRRQLNDHNRLPQSPVVERPVRHEPLGKAAGEKRDAGRVSVRITSVRKRLADPDNLVGKYFLDCCRYCGFLKDDTAADIEYTIAQRKVKEGEVECTEIQIN
jgi:hypothetical protein